jgi:hypothetical protein
MDRMRVAARVGLTAALLAGSVACGVLLAEATVRAYHWTQGRPPFGDAPFVVRDAELGWRANGGVSIARAVVDASGTAYRARVTTEQDGFRRSPDANGRPRILIIGDSFTHAVEVGDEHACWAVFARRVLERLRPRLQHQIREGRQRHQLPRGEIVRKGFEAVAPSLRITRKCASTPLSRNSFLRSFEQMYSSVDRKSAAISSAAASRYKRSRFPSATTARGIAAIRPAPPSLSTQSPLTGPWPQAMHRNAAFAFFPALFPAYPLPRASCFDCSGSGFPEAM